MNVFLRAIGFSDYININVLQEFFKFVYSDENNYEEASTSNTDVVGNQIYQFTHLQGDDVKLGMCFYAVKENDGKYILVDILPYIEARNVSYVQDVCVEKKYQGFAFAASCEHSNVGVSIIFRVSNPMEHLHRTEPLMAEDGKARVLFTAMSVDGTILLPISQTDSDIKRKYEQIARRSDLVASARTGDEVAIQSLAFEDMDTYAKLSNRIRTEDIYTIVESSFMPFGLETDMYSIIAEISEVKSATNPWTNEEIYVLTLDYNGMYIETAINKEDIVGEPLNGRRFKGVIWLQGRI